MRTFAKRDETWDGDILTSFIHRRQGRRTRPCDRMGMSLIR